MEEEKARQEKASGGGSAPMQEDEDLAQVLY
jgi:hypothetical protein